MSILNEEKLEEFRKEKKLQPAVIDKINKNIYKDYILNFYEAEGLDNNTLYNFKQNFEILSLNFEKLEKGENSIKFLFKTNDDKPVESVLMLHNKKDQYGNEVLGRVTICVSCQVGCPVGCLFCVTGKMGFGKNLEYEEILSQIIFANNYLKHNFGKDVYIRNVVFMGMGEPFLNYENIKKTINIITDTKKLNLSKKHITLSTSGVTNGINKMVDDGINIMLAISLHGPNQEIREKLIPISKKYKINGLLESIDNYTHNTGNKVFIEYIMIKDLNDFDEHAYELGRIMKNRSVHINLIPYNENPQTPELEESNFNQIIKFQKILQNFGIITTIRDNYGRKQKGACGQLGYEKIKYN